MKSQDDRHRLNPSQRWPGVAAVELGKRWRLIEEGLPGRTILHDDPIEGRHKNGMLALPMLLESHRPIDAIVVMLGTNDLKARFSLTPFDIAQSAEKLLIAIAASDCGVDDRAPPALLICPPPIHEAGWLAGMFAGGAPKSSGLAVGYAAVAKAHGAAFLDAGAVIASSPVDGVHFDADQHAALGRAVAAKLNSMFS